MGDNALRCHTRCFPAAAFGLFELHFHEAGSPRTRYDDRFQHGAFAARQLDWIWLHVIRACSFPYVFTRYCLEGSVPGFPFLASIIAIFSGAQLFALGVIGEYLARMHFRTMNRPAYAIRGAVEAAPSEMQGQE